MSHTQTFWKNLNVPVKGAAPAKIAKFFFILCLSTFFDRRKETRPNEAGALCSIIARKTII